MRRSRHRVEYDKATQYNSSPWMGPETVEIRKFDYNYVKTVVCRQCIILKRGYLPERFRSS